MNDSVISIVLIIIFLLLFVTTFCFIKWAYDYKLFAMLKAKTKGDAFEFDRIRREQMKKETEAGVSILDRKNKVKIPLISKYYHLVAMSGIHEKIPGLSELVMMIITIFIGLIIFGITLAKLTIIPAAAITGVYGIACWFILDRLAYERRMNVDGQLLQFTNSCASASRQYASLIDIIGSIYDQFNGPFRDALQECYVIAKSKFDEELAYTTLKSKFDSPQLSFVIDNLVMCSASTGDYYTVATDLSKTISIYITSHEKKMATLRNAKVNIVVMFACSFVIIHSLLKFFEGGYEVLLKNPIGVTLIIVIVGVFLVGISMKVD